MDEPMLGQRQGIILKTYLCSRNKVTVLDTVLGRIECIPDTQRLCLGGLIQYQGTVHEQHLLVHQVEQIAVPWDLAQSDILFLHHVLELCYLSVAWATREASVFALLCLLYEQRDWSSLLYKKLFLAKLYLVLHISLEVRSPVVLHLMNKMITESIDTVAHQLIDLNMEKELDKWLRACIAQHPYRNHFKTIHFYTRMASL